MKNKLFIVIFILLINGSFNAVAAQTGKKNHQVEAKCYVELLGGQQMIYLAVIKDSELKSLVNTLANRKIWAPFSKEKQQVYRAFECVQLAAKFRAAKANQIYATQPR